MKSSDSLNQVIPKFTLEIESQIRILVAEDNLVNQKVAVKILEKMGFHAAAVANGKEALVALNLQSFHLILMDCQMPEMDGYQATRLIREHELNSINQIPVVALTANAVQGERERCLEAGMNDYLTKPIQLPQLAATLKKWLTAS